MEQQNLEAIMGLIIHSGNAKSDAVEAHHAQTGLLTQEAQGNNMEISLLAVHSQDHLMTSIAFTDLAKEIVDLYKRID